MDEDILSGVFLFCIHEHSGGEGVSGIDIYFAVKFDYRYGIYGNNVYCNYDFPDGDLHFPEGQLIGELFEGSPGFTYALVRYDISNLGPFFVIGTTVDVGSWSEAESFNQDDTLKYHHFAYDRAIDGGSWTIPAQ